LLAVPPRPSACATNNALALPLFHKLTSSQAALPIALVTYRGLPGLSADDRLLLPGLAGRGIGAEPAAWDDPAVAWDSYEALVIRSTWNYHTSLDAFRAWIDRVDALSVPVWNPPAILRWNASKAYLHDLSVEGVDIVPTRWSTDGGSRELAHVLADAGWSDAVVKPAVSASAYETWRVTSGCVTAEDEARFRRVAGRPGGAMVQRFVPELAMNGEWSLMFIAGEYSHAVLKRPRAGDFRVQHEHGGSAEPVAPPAHALATARQISTRIPGRWLYARVDGVEIDGKFVLVELELLEPSMFLAAEPGAAGRFAEAIHSALSRGP
jgi:glutathione synthase/RimK-type ligase-like ATP-grasp enzyme